MTFGYRAFSDIFMEKPYKTDMEDEFVTFGYRAFFDIFVEKTHMKMIWDA